MGKQKAQEAAKQKEETEAARKLVAQEALKLQQDAEESLRRAEEEAEAEEAEQRELIRKAREAKANMEDDDGEAGSNNSKPPTASTQTSVVEQPTIKKQSRGALAFDSRAKYV